MSHGIVLDMTLAATGAAAVMTLSVTAETAVAETAAVGVIDRRRGWRTTLRDGSIQERCAVCLMV